MSRELLETAIAAAEAGASALGRFYGDPDLETETKSKNDFVSEADRASERAIAEVILARGPGHRILSEEAGWIGAATGGVEWVVDPLDGTSNFLQGLPVFAVSVACRVDGVTEAGVVLDPVRGDVFSARRGGGTRRNGRPVEVSGRPGLDGGFVATGYPFRAQEAIDLYLEVFKEVFLEARSIRRCGAAALDLAWTAAGVFDGFFEFRLSPWDLAAGALLIEEAGGVISDLDGGQRYLETGNVLAGSPAVWRDLCERAGRHVGEALMDEIVPRVTAAASGPC